MGFERPDAFIEKAAHEQSSGSELFDTRVIDQWESVRPKIEDFSDQYDGATREKDDRAVRERKREYRERGKRAMRLEYMVLDGIYSRNWLGPDTEVTPASEYDDLFNGVDIIVRINRAEGEPVFLGIDVTSADDTSEEVLERIRRKVGRIAEGLEQGKKSSVKYYSGDSDEPRGRVRLPRVVLGTDEENIDLLFRDYVAALESREGGKTIERHPMQIGLMHQIEKQLAVYTEHALRAYLKFRERTVERNSDFRDVQSLLRELRPIPPSQELSSPEWLELVQTLEQLRPVMTADGDDLGETVFQHIDTIQELQRLEKEKRSEGVEAGEVRQGTEDLLENGAKELLRAA